MSGKLETVNFDLDFEAIKRTINPSEEAEIDEMLREAHPLLRPKAVYKAAHIEARFENAVIAEGVRLESSLLPKLTKMADMIYPHVLTIGRRLEESADASKDAARRDCLDRIGNAALEAARNRLEDRLRSAYGLRMISYLSPGSLKEWPIGEQRALFSLLGGAESSVGVRLNRSGYMVPKKSTSGIYFATEKRFFSCLLCRQKDCPLRKAEYAENLAEEYGTIKKDGTPYNWIIKREGDQMEAISEELVNKTRKEISALSREEANREMLRTCETQPDLVAYMTKMTEGRKEDVRELGVYLLFVLHRIFKRGAGRNLKRIEAKEITKFHENNLQLMERLEAEHNEFVDRAARIQLAGQPRVMEFLVGALTHPSSGGAPIELRDEEKGLLYVLLKTSADLLDEKG